MVPVDLNKIQLIKVQLTDGDALVVVDMQNDFMPGGSLAVPKGDDVIPVMNDYIHRFQFRNLTVFASRDWHPANHQSFSGQGGPWPPHCIAGSNGAEFHPELNLSDTVLIISKGNHPEEPGYSVFSNPEFKDILHDRQIKRLFVGGVATDYCVLNCVSDALENGFKVFLLVDAIRAVNVSAENGKTAVDTMIAKGAIAITLKALQ